MTIIFRVSNPIKLIGKYRLISGGISMGALGWVYIVFIILFIIAIADFMRKTIRQREIQIDQMDQFIELYKRANGLNSTDNNDE